MPRASCLDAVSPQPAGIVRLALITYLSRDLLSQCLLFFRYYTRVERIPRTDIHVLAHEENAELGPCLQAVPSENVFRVPRDEPRGTRAHFLAALRRGVGHRRLGAMFGGSNATRGSWHRDATRVDAVMAMQRRLLGGGAYSHTLIVDVDEFVMANPEQHASLSDYLRANPRRRTAAPGRAFEVQVVDSEAEGPLDWAAVPLLRGQRSGMVASCGMRKPVLSRVPSHFTFSTHNTKAPLFFACAPDRWNSTADCLEPALWMVHTKCVDITLPTAAAAALADKDRGGSSASSVADYVRSRCGVALAWRQKGCRLGPELGGGDSPDGASCRRPFLLNFGVTPRERVHVERIPAWLLERL